eukprot:1597769-Lingulodinium_polyedra.AAC.1
MSRAASSVLPAGRLPVPSAAAGAWLSQPPAAPCGCCDRAGKASNSSTSSWWLEGSTCSTATTLPRFFGHCGSFDQCPYSPQPRQWAFFMSVSSRFLRPSALRVPSPRPR